MTPRLEVLWMRCRAAAVVAGLVLAAYAGALMFATPSGAQNACHLEGSWNQSTPEVGSTTWVIEADGKAQEQGVGNAKGQATLSGGVLKIDWRTDEGTPNDRDDDYAGTYSWTLNADCRGAGKLSFSKTGRDPGDGRTGKSYDSTVVGPPPTPPPPPPPPPGAPKFRVTSVHGEVAFRVNAGEWRLIKAGDPVTQDMELFTGVDSGMTVDMGDGSSWRLDELTQLLVSTIVTREDRRDVAVRLAVGEVIAKVKKEQVVDTNFEVQTPTTVASVRGTVFSVFYDPGSKSSLVTVNEGTVAVRPTRAGASEVLVPAGRELEVTPSGTSALAPLGKAGARGGVNRLRARALVLDRLDAARRGCRITVARSTAGLRVATARRGWLVAVKVGGRARGTSTWAITGGKARPRNKIAKRIARRCR